MKRFLLLGFFVCLGAAAGVVGLYWHFETYTQRPADPAAEGHRVVIPPGQGFRQTVRMLRESGIITDPLRFRLLALTEGYDRRIRAGEYLLSAAMSPRDILDKLARGEILLHRLTIPEGFTMVQIAEQAARAGFGNAAAFLRLARNPEEARKRGIAAQTLEGYLFPDTYHFPMNTTAAQIIDAMVDRFHQVFTDEWKARARELHLTVHEVVTLASIVERETGAPGERGLVASVFHNRIARGMRLQSDPTVIYGISDFDGNLTRKHLNTPTPYNTYQISGLPPGPIASPGAAALKATLYPPDTDYLYFVAKGDQSHFFSTNLKAHQQAVRKYQLGQ